MSSQIDLYTGIHKGQRYHLSKVSIQAGSLDVDNAEQLKQLQSSFLELREEFRLHASLEEKHIHPLLYDRTPEGAKELEEDHKKGRQRLEELSKYLDVIMGKPVEFEKRYDLALEFYRGLNRFISIYLAHINKEEEQIMPTLWKLCTSRELSDTYNSIMSSMGPDELMLFLGIMLPAMNVYECSMILTGIKERGPPEFSREVFTLAEQVLKRNEWVEIKHIE